MGRTTGPSLRDALIDLAWFASFVVAYGAIDVTTRMLSGYGSTDVDRPILLASAVAANPVPALVVAAMVGLALVRSPARFAGPWSSLEQGLALRLLAAPLIVLLVWQGALQPYDFLLDQSNLIDRALLVGFGVGALFRPALLVPLVAQQRVMIAPLGFSFGAEPGRNIDELLVIVLAVIAGAHLVTTITGRRDLSPVVGVIIAAVATHFFLPGVGKVRSGWLLAEDLRYLAPNAYAAGWLGQTDGGLAATLSSLVGSVGPVARVATIALELGAMVCAFRHRWFRWWLVPVVAFHLINFLMLGYRFLGWILVEVGLIVLLSRTADRDWLQRNATAARGLAVLATVLAGAVLFHPPRLSWYDSPVGEGYRIEAIGESGASYHVPFAAFAPFEEDLAFGQLVLGTAGTVAGPYGVVGGEERVDQLRQLTNQAGVDALRNPLSPIELERRDRSEDFVTEWLDRANRRARGDGVFIDRLTAVRAPTWFWTGRPEPTYRFQEPIARLRVDRLTSLTTEDDIVRWTSTLLVMEVDDAGAVTIVDRGQNAVEGS